MLSNIAQLVDIHFLEMSLLRCVLQIHSRLLLSKLEVVLHSASQRSELRVTINSKVLQRILSELCNFNKMNPNVVPWNKNGRFLKMKEA